MPNNFSRTIRSRVPGARTNSFTGSPPGQERRDLLLERDVVRRLQVLHQLPERGGIDKVQMPRDQFRKGVLGIVIHKSCEQLMVVQHLLHIPDAASGGNRTGNLSVVFEV